MAATWPGKDSETEPIGDKFPQWKVTMRTMMPSPCNKKLHASDIRPNLEQAGTRARSVLNQIVRRHIDGCKKCQANGIKRP